MQIGSSAMSGREKLFSVHLLIRPNAGVLAFTSGGRFLEHLLRVCVDCPLCASLSLGMPLIISLGKAFFDDEQNSSRLIHELQSSSKFALAWNALCTCVPIVCHNVSPQCLLVSANLNFKQTETMSNWILIVRMSPVFHEFQSPTVLNFFAFNVLLNNPISD